MYFLLLSRRIAVKLYGCVASEWIATRKQTEDEKRRRRVSCQVNTSFAITSLDYRLPITDYRLKGHFDIEPHSPIWPNNQSRKPVRPFSFSSRLTLYPRANLFYVRRNESTSSLFRFIRAHVDFRETNE